MLIDIEATGATAPWQLIELHGLWWAYEDKLPPLEQFKTHGRPPHPPILGPFPSRVIAEPLLPRHQPASRQHQGEKKS
jgi:hypothetical protein